MPSPTDLYTMTGKVPRDVEQNILLLRDLYDTAMERLDMIARFLEALPPVLTIEEIQEQLSAMGVAPLQTAGLLGTTPAPTDPPPPPGPDDGIPNFLDIVQAVHDSLGITGASTDDEMGEFIKTVANDINASGDVPAGLTCGLCTAPAAGANIFFCQGQSYRYGRLAFSNGHLFDVLIDADPGGARTPQWADNGFDPSLYATVPVGPC